MKFSKRCLASLTLALPLAMGATAQDEGPLAAGQDKFLGGVYSPSQLPEFEQYFNQVVSENAGKWGVITNSETRPAAYEDEWFTAEGDNSWAGGLDESVAFAEENGFPYRFHVMLWGNQQPQWIADLDEAAQIDAIGEWFTVVSQRYTDAEGNTQLDFVEVINEPVNDAPDAPDDNGQGGNYINALGGDGDTGWDWVIDGFTMAREHFPNSKLMINEYNVLSSTEVRSSYIEIIELLKERQLIDAVGIQAHAFSTTGTAGEISDALEEVAALELPIYITEMELDGLTDQQQLNDYRRVFPIFWEHEMVKGVTLWGFRPGLWRDEERAYLVDEDGNERPAMTWLKCYMDTMASGEPAVLPNQSIQVDVEPRSGHSLGQALDCYGANSSQTESWSIAGGSGENVLTIDDNGAIFLADGQSLNAGEELTLDLVAANAEADSEPTTVTISVSDSLVVPPSAELPKGADHGGSTNSLFLMVLALLGGVRVLRRRA
ncbi:endo-1,4-beta-xylanase [Marinimicrobium locisalis]|uniref:endo-1,4-beta-xylanase n=1 Tax=Marinimicrobium locisalis TaxID=546022 RepID=UPI00322198CE